MTYLIAPFAILISAHFLFRYTYYGDWLPNTYYAKHIRPWYESGFRYLWAAALETGLYLLLPLTWVALQERWRRYRDGTYALVLLLVSTHMAYVMRIGGDHFEYRPLDFYWPLLALPAAEGIAHLGARLAAGLRRKRAFVRGKGVDSPRAWAVILFVPVLFYASAIQGACSTKTTFFSKSTQRGTLNLTIKTRGGCSWHRGCRCSRPSPTTCAGIPALNLSADAPRYTSCGQR